MMVVVRAIPTCAVTNHNFPSNYHNIYTRNKCTKITSSESFFLLFYTTYQDVDDADQHVAGPLWKKYIDTTFYSVNISRDYRSSTWKKKRNVQNGMKNYFVQCSILKMSLFPWIWRYLQGKYWDHTGGLLSQLDWRRRMQKIRAFNLSFNLKVKSRSDGVLWGLKMKEFHWQRKSI